MPRKKDFTVYLEQREAFKKAKQDRRRNLLSMLALVYSIVAVLVVMYIKNESFRGILTNDDNQIERLTKTEQDIISLNQAMEDIKNTLDDSKYPSLSLLETKISNIEKKQNIIEETILDDADKALTARLLLDQQEVLKEDIYELKGSQIRLNSKIDNILITVLIIPLLGLLFWIARQQLSKEKNSSTLID